MTIVIVFRMGVQPYSHPLALADVTLDIPGSTLDGVGQELVTKGFMSIGGGQATPTSHLKQVANKPRIVFLHQIVDLYVEEA